MVLSGFFLFVLHTYIGFSSNCQLLIAPQYMVGPGEHLLIFAGMLTGLIFYLTVGNYSCCVFVVVIPMPVREDDIHSTSSSTSSFCFLVHGAPLALVGWDVLILVSHYRAEHPVSYSQSFDQLCISLLTAAHCKKRCLLSKLRIIQVHCYMNEYILNIYINT